MTTKPSRPIRRLYELVEAGRISLTQRGKAWHLRSRYVDLIVSELHYVSLDDLRESA
jgi:DNA-binding PadR family transcriptional regulator